MANYTLEYITDFGFVMCSRLTTLNVIENERGVPGSQSMDEFFLPEIFLGAIVDSVGCDFPIGSPRGARVYYQPNAYYFIPCPWSAAQPEFNTFFEQLRAFPIFEVTLQGERINNFYTDSLTA